MALAFWIVLGIVAVVVLVAIGVSLPFLKFVVPVFEQMPLFGVRKDEPDPRAERISFKNADGLTLRGAIFRPESSPRGAVLFCPELGGTCDSAMKYCEGLWREGYVILSFDFRNQGESEHDPDYKPIHWLTRKELADAQAAYDELLSRPDLSDLPLFVFGVSRGGGAALMLAARHRRLQRVFCDSVFTTDTMMEHYAQHWGKLYISPWLIKIVPKAHIRLTLKMARWMSRFKTGNKYIVQEKSFPKLRDRGTPILMVSGKRDSYVKTTIAETIQKRLGPTCEVWVVPKAKHNMARSVATEEYDSRVVQFFEPDALSDDEPESAATSQPIEVR